MEGYVITEALVLYYRTTLINTTVLLALLDSPFQIPVWLGRLWRVFIPKAIDMLSDCCTACGLECCGGNAGDGAAEEVGRGGRLSADPFERASTAGAVSGSNRVFSPSPPPIEAASKTEQQLAARLFGEGAGAFGVNTSVLSSLHSVRNAARALKSQAKQLASLRTIVGGEIWERRQKVLDGGNRGEKLPHKITEAEANEKWTAELLPHLASLSDAEVELSFQTMFGIPPSARIGANIECRWRRLFEEGKAAQHEKEGALASGTVTGLAYLVANAKKGAGNVLPHHRTLVLDCFREECVLLFSSSFVVVVVVVVAVVFCLSRAIVFCVFAPRAQAPRRYRFVSSMICFHRCPSTASTHHSLT